MVTNLWRSPPPNQFAGKRSLKILLAEGLIQADAIATPQLHLSLTTQHYTQQGIGDLPCPLVILDLDDEETAPISPILPISRKAKNNT